MREEMRLLNRAKSLLRHAHYNSSEFDEHRKYLISSIEDFECRNDQDHIAAPANMVSLRDQFAIAALQGIMANPSGPIQANGMSGWGWCNCSASDVANLVYSVADTMLKESKDD